MLHSELCNSELAGIQNYSLEQVLNQCKTFYIIV